MSFQHGSNAKVYTNGYNITTYLTEFSVTLNGEAVDTTTLGATWHDFIAGLRSGTFTGNGILDPTQEGISNALTNVIGSVWMYFEQGDTIGNKGFAAAGIQTSYAPTSPIGGATTFTFSGSADKHFDFIVSLHALGAETADTNFASVNNGASTSNGGGAYLEVTAFSGFSAADFKVQHSTDDAIWVDLATFTQVTAAPAKEQILVAAGATVNQYLRAVVDITGTGSVTFVMGFGRR